MTVDLNPESSDQQEAMRLARLRMLKVMDSEAEPLFDSLARLASVVCGTPIALITLLDDKRLWFKANIGLETIQQTDRELAFCAHAIQSSALMEVDDTRVDARFSDSPLVTGADGLRFYAGAPIVMPGGERLGTLCVIDREVRHLTTFQRDTLVQLADMVVQALILRERSLYFEIVDQDMARRKEIDAQLRASNSFLDRAERIAGVGGWEVDLRTRAVKWTDQNKRIFDLPLDFQPTFEGHLVYFGAEGQRIIEQTANEAIRTGQPWDLELPMRTTIGRQVWTRSVGVVEYEDGHPARLVGALQDITARKAAELELRQANQLLQTVMENLPGGLSVFNDELLLKAHNPQFRQLLDLPDSLFEGTVTTFESIIRHNALRGDYGNGPIEPTISAIVERARRPVDHQFKRTLASGVVLDIRGAPMPDGGFVTTYMDASAAEGASAITAATLQSTQDGILVINDHGEVVLFNKQFLRMWRIPPEMESASNARMIAFVLDQLVAPDTFVAKVEQLRLAKDADSFDVLDFKDGRTLERYSKAYLLDGRVRGRVWNFRDVSASRAAAAELQKAKDAAEAANQAKTNFLATMSHEIRTPLNGILGITQLLLDEPLNAQQSQFVRLIDSSAQSLMVLLDDFLDLAKIDAGKTVLEEVPFNLTRLLADVTDLFAYRASAKSLVFNNHVAPIVPQWIWGDPARLRQILANLLSNALKFTDAGAVSLTVDATDSVPGRINLVFAISDTGIGIPVDMQSHVFSNFVQADASTTRKYGGTGLGLSIVKQLAELMGGRVDLHSVPGQGSTFTLVLQGVRLAAESVSMTPTRRIERGVVKQPGRILVVEDNPTNQIVAVGLLKKIGFVNVTVAGNGKEAVDQASSGDFVAILMDCQMPVMDGYTATEILRAKACLTPIIAMTANASPADSQRCRAVGMNGYISKPVTSASLQEALKQSIPAAAEEQKAVVSHSQTPTSEELPVFGRETALKRMGGDADLLNAVVSSFTEQMPIIMRELEKALENNDSEVAARHLHSLLGSSASVSALQTHALMKIMNDAVAQGDTNLVRQNMPALQGCLALFISTAAGG